MQRLRLFDVRLSDLPQSVGLCTGDVPGIANFVNSAQRRLIYAKEAGEEGWWGGWAEMAFTNVSRLAPYITTPRDVARLQAFNVCEKPIIAQNQFFEYLQFGNGRLPKTRCSCNGPMEAYSRNNAVTFIELAAPAFIAAYMTDAADTGKRVILAGKDANGSIVASQDVLNQIQGFALTLTSPFAVTPFIFSTLTGIQKDITVGQVRIVSIDPTTGTQTTLLTMEPGEQTAWYRRYFLATLPNNCCRLPPGTVPQPVTVTAIAKLELIPVVTDTDYLLIQNLEALKHEAMAYRYSKMDTDSSKKLEAQNHLMAIRLLIGELRHYLGEDQPAVNFKPFGSARLSRQRIGSMI